MRGGDSQVGALQLRQRRAGGANVAAPVQADMLRLIELLKVRHTHRLVVAGAQANIAGGCPLDADFPGIGVEAFRVARVAVSGFEVQRLGERRIAHDRHARFRERFPEVLGGIDGRDRRAETGEVRRLKLLVRMGGQYVPAVLGTEHQFEAIGRPR